MSKPHLQSEDRGMLRSLFLRSFTHFTGFNYANYCGVGYCNSLLPAIRRFYPEGSAKRSDALMRSVGFFNCTYETMPFILGLNAAMEKENAQREDFDAGSIDAIKASLMGPLSAIGDSVFWGVVRTIAASLALPIAATGSILGPILFLLAYHIPSLLTRYHLLRLGYFTGSSFLTSINESGLLKNLTYCISIVGLIMIGSMTAQFVSISTPLQITFQSGETMALQEVLDSILKGILPLGFTFGFFALLRKKVKVVYLTFGTLALGILGALLGIF